jgi:hypothetical protein
MITGAEKMKKEGRFRKEAVKNGPLQLRAG